MRKYANAVVDPGRVEEVDVIWRRGALHEAFDPATHGTFEALIISHDLEHLPDPVVFLSSADWLLCRRIALRICLPVTKMLARFDSYRFYPLGCQTHPGGHIGSVRRLF